jgi:hypothetical protein
MFHKPIQYQGTVRCEGRCRSTVMPSQGFYHCYPCGYDICLKCLDQTDPSKFENRCKANQIHACPLKCDKKEKMTSKDLLIHL